MLSRSQCWVPFCREMLPKVFCVLWLGVIFTAATPSGSQTTTVRCAEIPNSLYRCLSSPKIVKHGVSTKSCDTITLECDRVKCIFTSSGWIQNGIFNKAAMSEYFTQFAHEKPDWSQAVSIIKEKCLEKELLPQGIHMECPEYDVMHCTLAAFIRNSNPSQWSSSEECEPARSFAGACPTCPTACFAPTIPAGSCNACLDWPK